MNFFYIESKSKTKKVCFFFQGVGEGVKYVIFFTKNPNLFFRGGGGGGDGA